MTSLNQQIWRRFAEDHGPNFDDVVHIGSLVTEPEALIMLVKDSLATATDPSIQSEAGLPRIRVFGTELLDYRASEAFIHTPYRGSDLIDWLAHIVGGREGFCVAFNLASADGVNDAFPEIATAAHRCRFRDCGHTSEPGCAVLTAVADGVIPERRLDSWRKIGRELAYQERKGNAAATATQHNEWKSLSKLRRARKP